MRLSIVCAAALAVSISLAGGARGQEPPASTLAAKTADSPETAPSGATFTLPKAWTVASRPQVMVATPPETDTRIAIVDVRQASGAEDAAAKAWALYRPEAHRTVKLVSPAPAREGWDEKKIIDYWTSPNERAAVQAIAFRSGARWTVVIVDGSEATVEKRLAAMGLIVQSLRPAGYHRESFAGRRAHALDPARLAALKAFVQTAMQELGVPGASVAIVEHGKVLFEGGFGVRELGRPEPVDAHTLFMVASNTKGMSTLLLARLVDQGKLGWDEPVTQAYPPFRLGSAETTRRVLMKHLVCACTGLPRKDLDWIFNTPPGTPATTTFAELAATEPTSGFGEVFQYNNLMASAAGYIGGHLVNPGQEIGAAYDRAMQTMIFDPLGMGETTFDMDRALRSDHASPHALNVDGKPSLGGTAFNYVVIPYRPAGGAWSSAHDMIRYVEDELTLGVAPDGRRLVSAKNLLERRAPNVPVGEDAYYGMGLEVDSTWGVPVVHHGGSLAGYKSDWFADPDAGVGAVILTNADEGRLMLRPFMRRLLEVLYDGRPEAEGDVAAAAARHRAEIAAERARLTIPAAADLAAGLAPRYVNPDLGHIDVRRDPSGVVFDFGAWSSHVATRRNDDGTLSFITIDPTVDGFEFVVATREGRRALVIRDGQHEYVYTEA